MSVSLEKYISQGFEQNREDDRNIWKVYISVYPSLRDFWNSVSKRINIVSTSFFFFLKAWEQYRFQWKIWCSNSNMQKYSRDTGFVLKKKCWISSLHLYRIIHELDKRCSNYYWVTKEENFFNFYHHQLLNHIYIY